MTPKEKALEIYERYKYALLGSGHPEQKYFAKLFAEIAVDEIIKELLLNKISVYYWQDVKKEIEKL